MLEIIVLIFVCKKMGNLAVHKGLKPFTWKLYTVLAWIFAEITGVLIGLQLFGQNNLIGIMMLGLVSAFGGYLPLVTQLVMDGHSLLLLLPIVIGVVWAFWPVKAARLRVATRFGWFSLALMLIAVASLYLPIIKMSMAVDAT